MTRHAPRGDFVGARFRPPVGEPLVSRNPARAGEPVLETACSTARIAEACAAAGDALPAWRAAGRDHRQAALERFAAALAERAAGLAEAIRLEVGKIAGEARGEAAGLAGRIAAVAARVSEDLADRSYGPHERLHYREQGVVGVIGPFNFPLHLSHAHVAPALLLGNTVVLKPSELTPLCGERYAEAAEAARLPAGVLNVVNGGAAEGAALADDPRVRAICFTGAYRTGRRIQEQALDRPECLVALELGGKNAAIVLDDADLRQAAHEIAIGACLTTGQRCTATSRVLVERRVAQPLLETLVRLLASVSFGDPEDPVSFAGPLATQSARERYRRALDSARAAGAELRFEGRAAQGGYYVAPSLHVVAGSLAGYTDEELFGPDLAVSVVDDAAEAVALLEGGERGLVHSVFSAERRRFERLAGELRVGLLNWNRSTNRASPRLPFGGVGRSGNFRPAGSHAPRNVAIPVALQELPPGAVDAHPALRAALGGPDLDALERRHAREEDGEAARTPLDRPRPLGPSLPRGGRLPESEAWLERLYAGGRVPREKKPPVVDHLRSWGPWLVSVDEQPLAVLDAMSQTATLWAGLAPDAVVDAYLSGAFGATALDARDGTDEALAAAEAFREVLRRRASGFGEIAFTNSGAEAVEKALALCRGSGADPRPRRVLAFEGSFHGRTLAALHATWSPARREPFEIAGYEALFAPFPERREPGPEPACPREVEELVASGELGRAARVAPDDALLASELRSLEAVDAALLGGECFACIVEPMQCEGGDRYASARFYRLLRLLTRARRVPLVLDEVQTGFGLGGPFLWHAGFGLRDAEGRPDPPDAVVLAKRAQLGVVLSGYPDPEPTAVHPASLVRGRIAAQHVDEQAAERVASRVIPRLLEIARRFPELVEAPRGRGFAFAFDLPDAEQLQAFLAQRFWRGAIAFAAGARTARYRLSSAFGDGEIDRLFDAIRRSLSFLDAHPGAKAPDWQDAPPARTTDPAPPLYRVRAAAPEEGERLLDALVALEARAYEPARRDLRETLALGFGTDGVAVVAELERDGVWEPIGSALGTPLERMAHVEGPDRDPRRGRHDTLYSVAVTVDPRWHGRGVGQALKRAQLCEAAARRASDGGPRYRYVSGRNRIGAADAMARLNRRFGAYQVLRFRGQYGEQDAEAAYYRMPLGPLAPEPLEAAAETPVDADQGLAAPVLRPDSLVAAERRGALAGPAVTRLTLCNYATPALVRAVEWVSALLPDHPHLYLASSRDEALDKTLRALRLHRPRARVAIGLAGGYLGHTSAAARSLSDPALHAQGPPLYDWPRVPHPLDAGSPATLAALREAVERAGGPECVFALVVELVQERTGRVLPDELWPTLGGWLDETGIPLVVAETASAAYRSGRGPFLSGALPRRPDAVIWWAGGQVGFVHVSERWFVDTPLALVSTWDGDELSLVRLHHQLRAARRVDVAAAAAALDEALAPLAPLPVLGLGAYRVVDAGAGAGALRDELLRGGVRAGLLPAGRLRVAPPLDRAERAAAALAGALRALGPRAAVGE